MTTQHFTPLTHLLLPTSRGADVCIAQHPRLTRSAFARQCLQLAARLQARDIRHAAFWFEDAVLFSMALFACWRVGITAVLAADVQAHSSAALTQRVDVWLTDTMLPHAPPALQWRIGSPPSAPDPAPLPASALDPNVQVVLCTSGSSGTPKHIHKRWQQLLDEVHALQRQWPMRTDDIACVLGSVSVQHMYGLPFRVLWPLIAGVPLDRTQHAYPQALQRASLTYPRCAWIASPALLRRLDDDLDWAQLRGRVVRVFSAGGVLPLAASDALQQRLGLRPTEIYGSSETGVIAWRTGAQDWQPFPDVHVCVNPQGALHVQSPWVHEQDGQTADGARLTDQGFTLLGRLDRIVKLEGKRIALPMLENALAQSPLIAQAHVTAVAPTPTDSVSRRLAALIALSRTGLQMLRQQGRMALIDALRAPLARQFAPLAVPRIWRFFAQLPTNTQGKLTQALVQQAVAQRPVMPDVHPLTTNQSASLAARGEVKRGSHFMEPKAPQTCGGEAPTARSGFFTDPASDAPHERLYTLNIPYDLAHFSGHFPAAPVVPGVAQIGWIMALAQRDVLPRACPGFRFGGIEALKFQRLIRPGDAVRLTLRFDIDKGKLYFAMTQNDQPCASGRILASAAQT